MKYDIVNHLYFVSDSVASYSASGNNESPEFSFGSSDCPFTSNM